MDEKKRKQIEAKLMKLFTQSSGQDLDAEPAAGKPAPTIIKVIRRRKGNSEFRLTDRTS